MPRIDEFELRIMELEQRLRPIADRPVDIMKPGWGANSPIRRTRSMKPALIPLSTCDEQPSVLGHFSVPKIDRSSIFSWIEKLSANIWS
jgi:hypothetical protein